MRVLLFSMDQTSDVVAATITTAGFVVEATPSSRALLHLARSAPWHAIIVHLAPSSDVASDVTRWLRSAGVDLPILVLSDQASPAARVAALSAGADDYVSRPFEANELRARLQVITRQLDYEKPSILTVGPLMLKLHTGEVFAYGNPVTLTDKEFVFLQLLAMRRGTVLTKPAILDHLYQHGEKPDAKIIDVFVYKIRKKLAAAGAEHVIGTVWGQGYTLGYPGAGGEHDARPHQDQFAEAHCAA